MPSAYALANHLRSQISGIDIIVRKRLLDEKVVSNPGRAIDLVLCNAWAEVVKGPTSCKPGVGGLYKELFASVTIGEPDLHKFSPLPPREQIQSSRERR